ncbi:MAG: GAF domain-containing protein [Anaerolineae bacterium]|nr:GAF domain-containing protein [Anaerolineae bacterium]
MAQAIAALADTPVGVWDAENNLVWGEAADDPPGAYPVQIAETQIGVVTGGKAAAALAEFLSYAAENEFEKRQMGREVLDSYRELNILYNISDKLAACSGVREMAILAIKEARKLIVSTGGAVMLFDAGGGILRTVAAAAREGAPESVFMPCMDVINFVHETGKAEIVNDVPADRRFIDGDGDEVGAVSSLVCVPLKAGRETMGVMTVINEDPYPYTAADLKLVAALALQTAPMIEQALAYEEKLRVLERELLELCVEIDEGTKYVSMTDIAQMAYFQELRRKAQRTRERREES